MRALLFEVRSWDVPALGAVAGILGICALLASFVPGPLCGGCESDRSSAVGVACRSPVFLIGIQDLLISIIGSYFHSEPTEESFFRDS